MRGSAASGRLVYSTEAGRMCPECRNALAQCSCGQAKPIAQGDGIVRVSRETKGRGGKAVTVVRGLAINAGALLVLGQQLKAACGSGGTVKDGVVEVQGDHCAKVIAHLQAQGHTVRRAGG